MSKPNEITEAVLKHRIAQGIGHLFTAAQDAEACKAVQDIYAKGDFEDFVGVVGKATTEERQRAANTARRLGHGQTARVIADGK